MRLTLLLMIGLSVESLASISFIKESQLESFKLKGYSHSEPFPVLQLNPTKPSLSNLQANDRVKGTELGAYIESHLPVYAGALATLITRFRACTITRKIPEVQECFKALLARLTVASRPLLEDNRQNHLAQFLLHGSQSDDLKREDLGSLSNPSLPQTHKILENALGSEVLLNNFGKMVTSFQGLSAYEGKKFKTVASGAARRVIGFTCMLFKSLQNAVHDPLLRLDRLPPDSLDRYRELRRHYSDYTKLVLRWIKSLKLDQLSNDFLNMGYFHGLSRNRANSAAENPSKKSHGVDTFFSRYIHRKGQDKASKMETENPKPKRRVHFSDREDEVITFPNWGTSDASDRED